MSKQLERHDISDELYVYKQDNSERWYARIKVAGKWIAKATKQKEKEKAIAMALRLQMEFGILQERGLFVSSKRFRDVAEKAISAMKVIIKIDTEKKNKTDKDKDKDKDKQNPKKHKLTTYIQVLRKYHIPFFDRTYITSIDSDKLREFDKWRIEHFGREPAKSTLLNHNAAMQLVFKEAVDQKWMLAAQVPSLSTKGAESQRRAHFTPEEYEKAFDAVVALEENSRKEKTRQIRELLIDYMEFAVYTGIRAGTEMDNLTWGDIRFQTNGTAVHLFITVTKGKTIKHTGTREIVCREEVLSSLQSLRERFPNRKPTDKLFRLADGNTTNELTKTFEKALKNAGLKNSPHGDRSLYSLRHSYITWQLLAGVNMEVLAKQCGTSVAMIEKHYSHVIPKMFSKELSGVDLGEVTVKKSIRKRSEKHLNILKEKYKEWEMHYKKVGCI
ncbi:site-specific integrase [Shewanella xiamenensis]|uniref:tyrosine-type recombinase/integrase n=1 Tax=Shewanella xiamenensis TaxID=332186 RepID=UPI00166A6056|nr:site-specific integrase [Shewanella xiamenensis]MCL1070185.1 site-specific integrase [Shewanella xiamenensis]GGM78301.1 site-specific recombinase phage integrase family protein [Shewanella xiamenensis]